MLEFLSSLTLILNCRFRSAQAASSGLNACSGLLVLPWHPFLAGCSADAMRCREPDLATLRPFSCFDPACTARQLNSRSSMNASGSLHGDTGTFNHAFSVQLHRALHSMLQDISESCDHCRHAHTSSRSMSFSLRRRAISSSRFFSWRSASSSWSMTERFSSVSLLIYGR